MISCSCGSNQSTPWMSVHFDNNFVQQGLLCASNELNLLQSVSCNISNCARRATLTHLVRVPSKWRCRLAAVPPLEGPEGPPSRPGYCLAWRAAARRQQPLQPLGDGTSTPCWVGLGRDTACRPIMVNIPYARQSPQRCPQSQRPMQRYQQ